MSNLLEINSSYFILSFKTPSKMHMYDMVKIDKIVFEIVGGLLPPPPRIVSCLKHPRSDRVKSATKIKFQHIFTKFRHDTKRTWSFINESLHVKKSASSRIFPHNLETLEDQSEIANAFNEHFISIGPSQANQLSKNDNFGKYLRNPSDSRLHFELIN